ncbi:PHP domain-containing protein [Terrabacter sp. MAHUQ-38]|uniref:PHP domain-containing protein n=1 Tax=unclassified Terrabacter TaxID=2630222 RepID=UPI00165DBEC5|nr:PHP domain-containing protein [Terrabacter sp. MAHUQ-38]MBC9823826.1 PHP domain-containing protein [Terrabacter sp. MAHUQ-38]
MQQPSPPQAPISPIDALRRICFLLERGRESSYRIDAFRRTIEAITLISDAELKERVDNGTLKQIKGIGDSSAAIIAQAVRGVIPAYLLSLEEKQGEPLTWEGAELYAALRGDLHTHSNWSDGGSPIEEMVLAAVQLGQEWMALTDHSPRLTVANGLSRERLADQLKRVDAINASLGDAFTLLKGIEVDIHLDGTLDQDDDMLDQLDVVTASIHSKLRQPSFEMTPRMVAAVRNPRTNVLAHCTGQLVTGGRGKRPPSQFDAEKVFKACLEQDVAVEINSRPERRDPPDELIELARDLGCLFTIDSDAHAPGQLDMKSYGCERAEHLGIPAERIVTTWPVDDVRAWAKG